MDLKIPGNSSQNDQTSEYFTPYNIDLNKMKTTLMLGDYISRVLKLSDKLKFLMTDFSSAEFIEEKLGSQFRLTDNQKSEVTRIIRDTLLSDLYIGDMPAEISKRLGIDPSTGREIANQIVSQLFTPALDDIKKAQAAKFPGRVAQRQATPPIPPQAMSRPIPGAELPESGGNIIDLRNQK